MSDDVVDVAEAVLQVRGLRAEQPGRAGQRRVDEELLDVAYACDETMSRKEGSERTCPEREPSLAAQAASSGSNLQRRRADERSWGKRIAYRAGFIKRTVLPCSSQPCESTKLSLADRIDFVGFVAEIDGGLSSADRAVVHRQQKLILHQSDAVVRVVFRSGEEEPNEPATPGPKLGARQIGQSQCRFCAEPTEPGQLLMESGRS